MIYSSSSGLIANEVLANTTDPSIAARCVENIGGVVGVETKVPLPEGWVMARSQARSAKGLRESSSVWEAAHSDSAEAQLRSYEALLGARDGGIDGIEVLLGSMWASEELVEGVRRDVFERSEAIYGRVRAASQMEPRIGLERAAELVRAPGKFDNEAHLDVLSLFGEKSMLDENEVSRLVECIVRSERVALLYDLAVAVYTGDTSLSKLAGCEASVLTAKRFVRVSDGRKADLAFELAKNGARRLLNAGEVDALMCGATTTKFGLAWRFGEPGREAWIDDSTLSGNMRRHDLVIISLFHPMESSELADYGLRAIRLLRGGRGREGAMELLFERMTGIRDLIGGLLAIDQNYRFGAWLWGRLLGSGASEDIIVDQLMAHPEASVDELVDTCGALARSLSGVR